MTVDPEKEKIFGLTPAQYAPIMAVAQKTVYFMLWIINNILRHLPLISTAFIGATCFVIGKQLRGSYSDLMVSISGNFLTFSLAIFTYDLAKDSLQKRANLPIFHYVKSQVDSSIEEICIITAKRIFTYEQLKRLDYYYLTNKTIELTDEEIEKLLRENTYLFFQFYQEIPINKLREIIQNDALVKRLTTEQLTSLIEITDALTILDSQNTSNLVTYAINNNFEVSCSKDKHFYLTSSEKAYKSGEIISDHGYFPNFEISECIRLTFNTKYDPNSIQHQVWIFRNLFEKISKWKKLSEPPLNFVQQIIYKIFP